jgi:histidine triad (HIT) family protein
MNDCLFCKIYAGEIPSKQEHNDEQCVVFHDINPKARIHLLVVPKKHIPTIMDLEEGDEQIIGHMTRVAKETAEKLGLEGYKLQYNVGEKGGQEVMHVHMHLMGN